MRKFVWLTVVVLAFSFVALAQNTPQAEVFGGYQYTRFNPGGGLDGINANGWNAAVSGNFNNWFAVKGEFDGAYSGDLLGSGISGSQHTFTFGPEFNYRMDKGKAFFHALFGGAHVSGGGASDTAFAMKFGGGADYNLTDKMAWRVFEVNYLPTHFDFGTGDNWQQHFTASTGIVFRLGSK